MLFSFNLSESIFRFMWTIFYGIININIICKMLVAAELTDSYITKNTYYRQIFK